MPLPAINFSRVPLIGSFLDRLAPEAPPASTSTSTISSKGVPTSPNFIYRAWGSVKGFFQTIWDWTIWIITLCPSSPSRIELVEEALENPTESAKKLAQQPTDSTASFVLAALENPEALSELLNEKKDAWKSFLTQFKQSMDSNPLNFQHGTLADIQKLLHPLSNEKSSSILYQSLFTLMQQNPETLKEAAKDACKRVAKVLSVSNSDGAKTLGRLFGKHLPELLEKATSKGIQAFHNSLYIRKDWAEFLLDLAPNFNVSEAFMEDLHACNTDDGLLFTQLQHTPNQGSSLARTALNLPGPIDLQAMFLGSLIKFTTKEQFESLAKAFIPEFPLIERLARQMQAFADDPERKEKIGANLPQALEVLSAMYQSYLKPDA